MPHDDGVRDATSIIAVPPGAILMASADAHANAVQAGFLKISVGDGSPPRPPLFWEGSPNLNFRAKFLSFSVLPNSKIRREDDYINRGVHTIP